VSSTDSVRPVGVHYDGDLRRALIDSAAGMIAECGADKLSLRDVARRLGVSHAAPAHHFGDKAGLLTAVATEGFERFIEHMARALAEPAAGPLELLAHLGVAYSEFAETQPGYFDVMFRLSLLRADDPAYLDASDAAFAALFATIERCQGAGWRPDQDTRALATAAWSLAHGIAVLRQQGSLQRHYPDPSRASVKAMIVALVDE